MNRRPGLAVVLDTNVLLPPSLRDVLLYAADAGLLRPHWGTEILEELRRNLIKKLNLSEEAACHRIRTLCLSFPDAAVDVTSEDIARLSNDSKDRHVLAVAIEAGARVIVTQNVKHFPPDVLAPYSIQAWSADACLTHLLRTSPESMMAALREHASRLRNPPTTMPELLKTLSIYAPQFAQLAQNLHADLAGEL
ncbi:MAG TPA: PIN domain-containing protein [Armatimonadota bacterium]|jgi:predicted nucleic acid-binding protein